MEEPLPVAPAEPPSSAGTIEPSKILTPPDMEVYFNAYRTDQENTPANPPPPASVPPQVFHPVAARRMRSVSASAAFDLRPPFPPGTPPTPTLASHNALPGTVNPAMQIAIPRDGVKETEGLRSPRTTRRSSFSTPSDGPMSPRGDVIPTEIPGSPKRKRHTVSVGENAGAANAENGKKRRQRQKKTPNQVAVLERHFVINPHPDKQTRDTLALQLGFTSRQVQIWFQNARAKAKQNAKKNGLDISGTVNGTTVQPQLNNNNNNPTTNKPHPQLTGVVMPPGGGIPQQHLQQQQQHMQMQMPGTQTVPTATAATNINGGRKIFSAPFPADIASPPHSPFLSSLALSPRFPPRSLSHSPILQQPQPHHQHQHPMAYSVIPTTTTTTATTITATTTTTPTTPDNNSNAMSVLADTTDLDSVVSMEDIPCTPPVLLASSVPTEVSSSSSSSMSVAIPSPSYSSSGGPLSPPPPASPLDDFPQLSMSAPAPLSALQKQLLGDANNLAMSGGITPSSSLTGGGEPYEDFLTPSSPPQLTSFGPPLVPEESTAAVFICAQNQKAALMHLEYNPLQQQLLQQQQLQLQHQVFMQQQFMQQQQQHQFQQQHQQHQQHQHQHQQHQLASSRTSAISEMDFFFYEAPSKNLVQFGEGEGESDFFWGGVDSLNP